jgi:hypothetical protein
MACRILSHHNDFFGARHPASSALAERALTREFPQRVIVSSVTYLQYAARETLLEQGWSAERIETTAALRA